MGPWGQRRPPMLYHTNQRLVSRIPQELYRIIAYNGIQGIFHLRTHNSKKIQRSESCNSFPGSHHSHNPTEPFHSTVPLHLCAIGQVITCKGIIQISSNMISQSCMFHLLFETHFEFVECHQAKNLATLRKQ